MSDTVKIQKENWEYLQENGFFKNEKENITVFRWVSRLNNMNYVTNTEGKAASINDLVKLGALDKKETSKLLTRLRKHGLMIQKTSDKDYFIFNPNLAFKTYDKKLFSRLELDFILTRSKNEVEKLPVSVWDMDLSEC
ncbi:hypothetical protein LKM00_26385 [Bacillus wiedmannii]|uniref:hypothetical protein n=1 Tax=Bacillus wiedmannii TaxID=1890302 RepID=UPI001E556FE3|nr:hypothetical protein [Bacillus wiedmannii]MCC2380929.1 hypothetical protein [Bacillus wiedmannii]MCC2425392.1 hypothetical protein [Bacillus wiedmannii]